MKSSKVWVQPSAIHDDSVSDNDNSFISALPDVEVKQEFTCNSGNPHENSFHIESVRLPVGLQNDSLNVLDTLNFSESVKVLNAKKLPNATSMKKVSQKFVSRCVALQDDVQKECSAADCMPMDGQGTNEKCYMYKEFRAKPENAEDRLSSGIGQVFEKSQESRIRQVIEKCQVSRVGRGRTRSLSRTRLACEVVAREAIEQTDVSSQLPPDSGDHKDDVVVSDTTKADVEYVSDGFSGYESLDDSFVRFRDDSEDDDGDHRQSGRRDEDDGDDEYFPSNYKRKKRKRNVNTKTKRSSVSQIKDVSEIKDECLDPMFSDSWKIPDVMRLSDKMYACTFCIQICPKLKDARKHVLTHFEFRCDLCDKRFLSAEQVQEHTRDLHGENHVNECPSSSCDFTSKSKEELSKHISDTHANEDLPDSSSGVVEACGIVDSTDNDRGASSCRKRSSSRVKRYAPGHGSNPGLCYICGVLKRCLREHLYNVHGTHASRHSAGQRDLTCSTCAAEFPNRLLLQNHRLTWHTEKTVPCRFSSCPALFKTKGLMQTHYKSVHLGIKRYVCTYEGCSFRSGNKATFANHTKAMHLKIRSHPCTWPECSKSFYDKKHLVIHERIHADVKPLCCEFCDYRCRQRAALNWHLMKKHKDQTAARWDVGSTPSNASWRQADVPVGIPAPTHALKPGRKKKSLS